MRLIDRYLLKQFLGPSAAATAALVGIALLAQTLTFLDIMVGQRQGVLVFLKIVMLTMPQMLVMVLPIAVFVAMLLTLNRLHTEQEIVVCYAGGMSRWQVTSPAFKLAAFAALFSLVINLWVQPICMRALRDELFRISTDLAASLVREGEFSSPGAGKLTVYTQSVDSEGLLKNVFIHEEKQGGESSTYTAERGLITSRDGKPIMILKNGANQQFNGKGVLNYLAFEEYALDLSEYLNTSEVEDYKISDRFLHELLYPNPQIAWDIHNKKKYAAEAHYRLSSPLYNISFMALALYGLLGGAFSRNGYGSRIAAVAATAGVVRILGFIIQAACDSTPALNLLQYVVPLAPILYVLQKLYGRTSFSNTNALQPLAELTPIGGVAR